MPRKRTPESDIYQRINEDMRKEWERADREGDTLTKIGTDVLGHNARRHRDRSYE